MRIDQILSDPETYFDILPRLKLLGFPKMAINALIGGLYLPHLLLTCFRAETLWHRGNEAASASPNTTLGCHHLRSGARNKCEEIFMTDPLKRLKPLYPKAEALGFTGYPCNPYPPQDKENP